MHLLRAVSVDVSFFHDQIAPDHISLVSKTLAQPGPARVGRAVADPDVADPRCCRLLGLGRQRKRRMSNAWPRDRRPAEQRDELATSHSITSTALASNPGGTINPRAFAVRKLIVRSKLV